MENEKLYVYYYDAGNDLYRVWDTIGESVEVSDLKNLITLAMRVTWEEHLIR